MAQHTKYDLMGHLLFYFKMRFWILILIFSLISCNNAVDVQKDIIQIEQLLQIKIEDAYEVLVQENNYPIKSNIIHSVVFRFSEKDYEKIYAAATVFFIRPSYDPLYPDQNLSILYYESEKSKQSIYIDTTLKQLHFTALD